ncbi:endo-beta-xylanase A [Colletotrichum tofieldiae]|uniref:Beta-xylanase n=1 Tax=Colletotrichum tofieldiae TaxID=708197 RepID=A0A161VRP0_9PEZI|nr:endo-beta-xylanase A (glycosyl hydrolase family 10) [Colletotrichum tofieldiae]GKT63102.1 endo-beta-xylanase A [Colletotrichum tofieldiae]GKT72882.1 endo-beta-xylanase A [Colletotrichum tofieldiae]GKT89268.1 endo-beta-xylanase A [Colletotrichum tofieldiae]
MYAKAFVAVLLGSGLVSAQLNTLAVRAGLKYFGTAVGEGQVNDATYRAIVNNKNEFGSLVPENGQKWQNTEPNRGSFSYGNADIVPNIAKANGQILRCHTLTWHSQLPNWVSNGQWTATTLTSVIETHIANVIKHYLGQCYAWDVVNEAADDDGSWRKSVFYNVLGTNFLPISFRAAKAADPSTKLYYNDYNLEYNGAKTNRVYEAVTIVQKAGAPIDGVGLQGHLIVGSTPSRSALATVLRRFTALNLEVAYTELDIRHSSLPASSAASATQGNDYANVVGSCLDVAGCVGVTIWGFTDKYSWIPGTFPGTGDALLWDSNYNKKPAYTSVSALLAAAATGGSPSPPTSTASGPGMTLITSSASTTTTPAPGGGGQSQKYGQCGGQGWPGPFACVSDSTCTYVNAWYSQCL